MPIPPLPWEESSAARLVERDFTGLNSSRSLEKACPFLAARGPRFLRHAGTLSKHSCSTVTGLPERKLHHRVGPGLAKIFDRYFIFTDLRPKPSRQFTVGTGNSAIKIAVVRTAARGTKLQVRQALDERLLPKSPCPTTGRCFKTAANSLRLTSRPSKGTSQFQMPMRYGHNADVRRYACVEYWRRSLSL
jgi:hypothetical protein